MQIKLWFVYRYHTRMCILKMNTVEGQRTPGTGRALEQLADEASSALPVLLRGLWEMVPDDIDRCMTDLKSKMSLELRILEGLSVPVAVARKVNNSIIILLHMNLNSLCGDSYRFKNNAGTCKHIFYLHGFEIILSKKLGFDQSTLHSLDSYI